MSAFDRYVAERMAQLGRSPVAPVGNPFQGSGPVRPPVNLGPPPSERQVAIQNSSQGPPLSERELAARRAYAAGVQARLAQSQQGAPAMQPPPVTTGTVGTTAPIAPMPMAPPNIANPGEQQHIDIPGMNEEMAKAIASGEVIISLDPMGRPTITTPQIRTAQQQQSIDQNKYIEGVKQGDYDLFGHTAGKTYGDVMGFIGATPEIAEMFLTGQLPEETGIRLDQPIDFSIPDLFGRTAEVAPDQLDKPVNWALDQINKPLEWNENRAGELMYNTAKSGEEEQAAYPLIPISIQEAILGNTVPKALGFDRSIASVDEFNRWALENRGAIINAYEKGYTPEKGAFAGQEIKGDRAVWELFINQQGIWERIPTSVGMDPTTSLDIVAGGFGGKLSAGARSLRAVSRGAEEAGAAADAARAAARARKLEAAAAGVEVFSDPIGTAAKVVRKGVGLALPDDIGQRAGKAISGINPFAQSDTSIRSAEDIRQEDILAQVEGGDRDFVPEPTTGGSTSVVEVTNADGKKGYVVLDENGRPVSQEFFGGKKAKADADAAKALFDSRRAAGPAQPAQAIPGTQTAATQQAQPPSVTTVAQQQAAPTQPPVTPAVAAPTTVAQPAQVPQVPSPQTVMPYQAAPQPASIAVPDGTINWDVAEQEIASRTKTVADRNQSIKNGSISQWTPIPDGNRLVDDATFGVGRNLPQKRAEFWNEISASIQAHVERLKNLKLSDFTGPLKKDAKTLEEVVSGVEQVVDNVAPAYIKHFGPIDEIDRAASKFEEIIERYGPKEGRTKAQNERVLQAGKNANAAELVTAAVYHKFDEIADEAIMALDAKYMNQAWYPSYRQRITEARTRAKAIYGSDIDTPTTEGIFGVESVDIEQLPGFMKWQNTANNKYNMMHRSEQFPEHPVPTANLRPTQEGFNADLLDEYRASGSTAPREGGDKGSVTGYFHDGKVYVDDGHHRAAAAILNGETELPVHILNENEYLAWQQTNRQAAVSAPTTAQMPTPSAAQAAPTNPPAPTTPGAAPPTAYTPPPLGGNPPTATGAAAPTPATPQETPWSASLRKGNIDQTAYDFFEEKIKVNDVETPVGEVYWDILRKHNITENSPLADWRKAKDDLKKAIVKARPELKRVDPRGWGKLGHYFVKTIDTLQALKRDSLMFSPTNIGGFIGDTATDIITPLLHGDVQTAISALNVKRKWQSYKHARAGTPEAKALARQNISGIRQIEDAYGQVVPHELEFSATGSAGEAIAGSASPYTTLQRGVRAVTNNKLGRVGDIITSPLGGSAEYRAWRLGSGEQVRFGAYSTEFHRQLREAGIPYFNELLDQTAKKLGKDADAWRAEIQRLAQERFNQNPWGKRFKGEFSPQDVLDATGIDDLSRKWRNQISEANKKANAKQKYYYHDYLSQTKADEVAKRTFLFHFWASRQLRLYGKLAAQNPFLLNASANFWEGVNRQAEEQGLPEWLGHYTKFMGDVGHMYTVFDAMGSVLPWSMFDDIAKDAGDGSLFDQFVDKSPLMVAPWFKAAMTVVNAHRPNTGYVDPFFSEKSQNVFRTVVNWADANGVNMPEWAKDHNGYQKALSSLYQKAANWGEDADLPDLGDSEVRQIGYIVYDLAKDGGYSDEELGAALDALKAGGDDGELLDKAEDIFWTGKGKGTLVGTLLPGGTQTRYGPGDSNRALAEEAYDVPVDERTPAQEAAVTEEQVVKSADTEQTLMFDQYDNLGTERQRALADGYNIIAHNNVPSGEVVIVGNQVFTKADMNRMTQDERYALADRWIETESATEEYGAYKQVREDFAAKSPELAELDTYRDAMRAYPGGPIAGAEYLASFSPSFEEYWDESSQDEAAAMSRSAWLAQKGAPETIYDNPKSALDISKVPASTLLPGFGGGGQGKKTFDPATDLATDLAEYEMGVQMADAYVSQITGGRITSYEDLDPSSLDLVDQQLEAIGLKPKSGKNLDYYLWWRDNQVEGADTSTTAFIEWRDKWADDLGGATIKVEDILAAK